MENEQTFENTSPVGSTSTPTVISTSPIPVAPGTAVAGESSVVSTPPTPATPGTVAAAESSVGQAIRVMNNTETVTGGPRQIVDAGLLGVCIAFMIALLSMQLKDIDGSLNAALNAFSIAMPLIGWGFLQSFVKAKPTPGWRLLQAILIGSAIAESVGELMVCIGILFILHHFSFFAFTAFIWSSVFAVVGVSILSFIGLLIYAVFKSKAEERAKKQQATNAGTPSTPPAQGSETLGPAPAN